MVVDQHDADLFRHLASFGTRRCGVVLVTVSGRGYRELAVRCWVLTSRLRPAARKALGAARGTRRRCACSL
ncbi:hypothetical protein ACFPRL_22180 [Pseudoclavibacter helvolus]